MMKIVIPKECPPSWNKIYAGMHWGKRKEIVDYWHNLVWIECKRQKIPMIKHNGRTLAIHTTCYFKSRRVALDPDNIFDKIIIDPLKGHVIEGDSCKYIKYVTTESRVDPDNPRTEIVISFV